MFIGHLPASYLSGRYLCGFLGRHGSSGRCIILTAMLGSVAPDIDLVWFYLVDAGRVHHHQYWPHLPIFWFSLTFVAGAVYWFFRGADWSLGALVFSLAGVMHIVLDSIVGDIWWFGPFVDRSYSLFTVPTVHDWWVLNFIFHFSFTLEIVLLVWAITLRCSTGKYRGD